MGKSKKPKTPAERAETALVHTLKAYMKAPSADVPAWLGVQAEEAKALGVPWAEAALRALAKAKEEKSSLLFAITSLTIHAMPAGPVFDGNIARLKIALNRRYPKMAADFQEAIGEILLPE